MTNIQLASVVIDVFGKFPQALIQHLLQHSEQKILEVLPFLQVSIKEGAAQIAESLNAAIDSIESQKMQFFLNHMEQLDVLISTFQVTADLLTSPFTFYFYYTS